MEVKRQGDSPVMVKMDQKMIRMTKIQVKNLTLNQVLKDQKVVKFLQLKMMKSGTNCN